MTKTECSAMRGLAIQGIVLHNYCHWLGFAVKENEYIFSIDNCQGLWHALCNPTWNLPIHLISFFGHYGVPIFLFLSGYGLTKKYVQSGKPLENTKDFILSHFAKLFKMMIVGFVAFILIDAITPGRHHYDVWDVFGQLFMFNNFFSRPDVAICPGPYWFFGLMLQLYILYRLFVYQLNREKLSVFILICCAVQMLCAPESDTLNYLRYNFIGGMLPFALGIMWAKYEHSYTRSVYIAALLLAVIVTFAFSFSYYLWLWVPMFICILAVAVIKLNPLWLNKVMAWVGSISAALFVVHPITRKILIPISRSGDVYVGILLYIVCSLVVAWIFRALIQRIPFTYHPQHNKK